MTREELADRVSLGHLLLVGELRSADVRPSGYVDEKSGNALKSLVFTYYVELLRRTGFEIAKVTRWVPANAGEVAIPPVTVQRGRRYVFEVDKVEAKRGFLQVTMRNVEPEIVEDSAPPHAAPLGAAAADA